MLLYQDDFLLRHYDSGECQGKLGHSRLSVILHRTQVRIKQTTAIRAFSLNIIFKGDWNIRRVCCSVVGSLASSSNCRSLSYLLQMQVWFPEFMHKSLIFMNKTSELVSKLMKGPLESWSLQHKRPNRAAWSSERERAARSLDHDANTVTPQLFLWHFTHYYISTSWWWKQYRVYCQIFTNI